MHLTGVLNLSIGSTGVKKNRGAHMSYISCSRTPLSLFPPVSLPATRHRLPTQPPATHHLHAPPLAAGPSRRHRASHHRAPSTPLALRSCAVCATAACVRHRPCVAAAVRLCAAATRTETPLPHLMPPTQQCHARRSPRSSALHAVHHAAAAHTLAQCSQGV